MKSKIDRSTEEITKNIVPLILGNCTEPFRKVEKISMAHSQFTWSVNVCSLFPVVPEALACHEDDGYLRCSDVLLAEGSVSF